MQKVFATALLTAAAQALSLRRAVNQPTNLVHLDLEQDEAIVFEHKPEILLAQRTYNGGSLAMIDEPRNNLEYFLAEVGYSVTCSDTFDRFEENPDVASVLSAGV